MVKGAGVLGMALLGGVFWQKFGLTGRDDGLVSGNGRIEAVALALRALQSRIEHVLVRRVMELTTNVTRLSVILTGAALIREREHGTVEHLLAMPVTSFEIMTAKMWAMALVVLAVMA